MRTFAVVPRGKSYWVEATSDNGVRKMIIGFRTEEAALRCLKDFQRREERNEAPLPRHHKTRPPRGRLAMQLIRIAVHRLGVSLRAGCYAQERAEPKASPPIRVTPPHASYMLADARVT
jgi:hypothetical protein